MTGNALCIVCIAFFLVFVVIFKSSLKYKIYTAINLRLVSYIDNTAKSVVQKLNLTILGGSELNKVRKTAWREGMPCRWQQKLIELVVLCCQN
ncbi:hypothetical protein DXX93_18900 [Thalassotalea euphylliae]|uniref:Uncharacterized protein n=1 Tax=Thalassotalea euphylliae TaxID=1655234 RepID=A0A3E0TVD0_9GAMM|nr:hypothetical protein DXX93_18900 [Thalassotalea euphylliae]